MYRVALAGHSAAAASLCSNWKAGLYGQTQKIMRPTNVAGLQVFGCCRRREGTTYSSGNWNLERFPGEFSACDRKVKLNNLMMHLHGKLAELCGSF